MWCHHPHYWWDYYFFQPKAEKGPAHAPDKQAAAAAVPPEKVKIAYSHPQFAWTWRDQKNKFKVKGVQVKRVYLHQ